VTDDEAIGMGGTIAKYVKKEEGSDKKIKGISERNQKMV